MKKNNSTKKLLSFPRKTRPRLRLFSSPPSQPMDESPLQHIPEIGGHFGRLDRPGEGILVRLLRQVATALLQTEHPLLTEALQKLEAKNSLEVGLESLRTFILKRALLQHNDRGVKFFITVSVSGFFRILAPHPINFLRANI